MGTGAATGNEGNGGLRLSRPVLPLSSRLGRITSCFFSETCQDRWHLASSPVNSLRAGWGGWGQGPMLLEPTPTHLPKEPPWGLGAPGWSWGGRSPGPSTLWWRGLLATKAWPRASGKELGQAPGEAGWSRSHPRDFTPGVLGRKSLYFFQTPSLYPAPPPAWPRVWGHAEEQPEGLSQKLLGWLWPRLFLQERRTRGPFCVWELIAKSHLGCHSSPDQLPEECKGERGREKERVGGRERQGEA